MGNMTQSVREKNTYEKNGNSELDRMSFVLDPGRYGPCVGGVKCISKGREQIIEERSVLVSKNPEANCTELR